MPAAAACATLQHAIAIEAFHLPHLLLLLLLQSQYTAMFYRKIETLRQQLPGHLRDKQQQQQQQQQQRQLLQQEQQRQQHQAQQQQQHQAMLHSQAQQQNPYMNHTMGMQGGQASPLSSSCVAR